MSPRLRVDSSHLWRDLMYSATIGATLEGGLGRQALTAEDHPAESITEQQAAFGADVLLNAVLGYDRARP